MWIDFCQNKGYGEAEGPTTHQWINPLQKQPCCPMSPMVTIVRVFIVNLQDRKKKDNKNL
jgi:hypothetical protein